MAPRVDRNKKVTSGGASCVGTGASKNLYWARPVYKIAEQYTWHGIAVAGLDVRHVRRELHEPLQACWHLISGLGGCVQW